MKTVQVLLAAYNGEKYIQSQIESIMQQQGVQVSLLARDDGSKDSTWEILSTYAKKFENMAVYKGKNKGAAGSFFDLLIQTDTVSDYYAFSDQDDVWQKDKLLRALECLEEEQSRENSTKSLPLLYAGKVICASCDLKDKREVSYRVYKKASFGNALVENICMGCTQVFNKELLYLAREHLPDGDMMHDWWMYLAAAYFGRVIYDEQAHMLYRQHENNQVGMQSCWLCRWKNRLLHLTQLRSKLSRQAMIFWKAYDELLGNHGRNMDILKEVCNYRSGFSHKIRLVTDRRIYRQNTMDDFIYRFLFLIGYL